MRSSKHIGNINQLDFFPPTTTWITPAELPDWRRHDLIAIDLETRDDGLSKGIGAGWALPDHGHIVGISMAVSTRDKIYVPVRHPDSENFEIDRVIRWVKAHLDNPIVFHNAVYDLGWLQTDFCIAPNSMQNVHDTLAIAVMLDENRNSYSLDNLCKDNNLPSKNEQKLREAGTSFGIDPKKELWKLPAKYVGEYAEQDAVSTFLLYEKLYPLLFTQDLFNAYRLEMDLIPLVNIMRRRGIRVSLDKAEAARKLFFGKRDNILTQIKETLGLRRTVTVDNVHSPKWLEYAFDEQGIDYPRTPKLLQGQFKSEWLEAHDQPLPRLIANARKYHDAGEKFIKQYILDYSFNGRIFSEIHHIRSEDGGTRSYRFSYSDPPLQQMPGDSELGPVIRGIFLPEVGEQWGSFDLKGQEPALTVHTAAEYRCIGSKEAVEYYNTDPNPDYHSYVAEITGIPRKRAKIINLSITYGLGLPSLCRKLGIEIDEGEQILDLYNKKMPFVSQLIKILTYEASSRGYITLLDGARCRFDAWEPISHHLSSQAPAPSYKIARKRWPGQPLMRYGTHKALNRKIQGGAARQIKMVMRECYNQKLYPLLQVHDELDFSISDSDIINRISDIMCNTVPLVVPTRTDLLLGSCWGDASD